MKRSMEMLSLNDEETQELDQRASQHQIEQPKPYIPPNFKKQLHT